MVVAGDMEVSILVVLDFVVVVAVERVVVVVGTFVGGVTEVLLIDWAGKVDRKEEAVLLVVEEVVFERLVAVTVVVCGVFDMVDSIGWVAVVR